MEDPQSVLQTEGHPHREKLLNITGDCDPSDVTTWIERVLSAFDVVKVCYASFKTSDYRCIIDTALNASMTPIIVHRNPFKRALSLQIASELTRQSSILKEVGAIPLDKSWVDGYSNELLDGYLPFHIDPDLISSSIQSYVSCLENTLSFCESIQQHYYFLDISRIHSDSNKGYELFFKELGLIGKLDLDLLQEFASFKPKDKKSYVLNLDTLREMFASQTYHLPPTRYAHHMLQGLAQ